MTRVRGPLDYYGSRDTRNVQLRKVEKVGQVGQNNEEREVGHEKAEAGGGTLKEKTRRRDSETNCYNMLAYVSLQVGRDDFRGYTPGQGKRRSI